MGVLYTSVVYYSEVIASYLANSKQNIWLGWYFVETTLGEKLYENEKL